MMDCGFFKPPHRLVEAWTNCKLLRRRWSKSMDAGCWSYRWAINSFYFETVVIVMLLLWRPGWLHRCLSSSCDCEEAQGGAGGGELLLLPPYHHHHHDPQHHHPHDPNHHDSHNKHTNCPDPLYLDPWKIKIRLGSWWTMSASLVHLVVLGPFLSLTCPM